MDSNTPVNFKVTCSNEPEILRRLTFPRIADVSYQALHSKLSQLYNTNNFKIRYTDEDKDAITIDNDFDLREAIEHNKSLSNGSPRLVIWLTLEEVKPSLIDKELPKLPNHSSSDIDLDKVPTSNESNGSYNDFHEYLFESVLNPGIKNLQDIVQSFVTQVSTTLEREFARDSSNLNMITSSQSQPQNIGESIQVTKDSTNQSTYSETSQVPTQEPQTPLADPVVHEDVICDFCRAIISGTRWKCNDCPNFDLCQPCKSKSLHDIKHHFVPIYYPKCRSRTTSANIGRFGSNHHSATCDYCESVIIGIRHKCINCPDFDLCNNCIALAPTQHPAHTFMPIHKAGEPEIKIPDSAFHPGIRCDGCRKAINGVRYKCGNCLDFDLCGNCEANPISKHDENHVFIKIKKPVSQRLRTDKPLLHDFYSKVDQKTVRAKDCRQSSQFNNIKKEMESVSRQPSLVNSNSDASSSNPFVPLIKSTNSEDTTEKIISRAPIDLYNYPLGAKSTVPSSSPEKLAKETVKTNVTQSTPSSPLSTVTTITSQDEAHDVPYDFSVEIPTEKRLSAKFIGDANVPDGTILLPQAQFRKMWIMTNDGDIAWPENTALRFFGGQRMFNEALRSDQSGDYGSLVGKVEPEKDVYVSVDLQAPSEPGKYISYWFLTDNEGNTFGHKIWCEINVEAVDDQSSSMSSSMIFPVLNYDQKLTQSATGSIQSPASTSSEVDNFDKADDLFQDSAKSTVNELQNGNLDLETTSELNSELYNSDDESDTSSIVSDSSQDFIVVDKDSDDDDMENSFINSSEVRSSISNSLVMSSCGDNTPISDDFKDESNDEIIYKEEISKLAEMGFTDTDMSYNLLLAYDGNIDKVIDSFMQWER